MGTQIFLGKPPANIEQWIKDHHGPVVKETTAVKYTAASGLPDWEWDIVGELTYGSIPNISDIVEVEIGSHVTSIESSVFSGCSSLTSVTIGNRVMSIGVGAFGYCSSLTSVTIPDSVMTIQMYAFEGCSSLMSVTFSGKDKATVQDMENYSWELPSGCVIHCTDGDIAL